MIALNLLLALLGLTLATLLILRMMDRCADRAEWRRLAALQPAVPPIYDPAVVADLPEPARRFFSFVITPGTPLLPVAEIDMGGLFSLGSRSAPKYQSMHARQILAAPHGFVWRLYLSGALPVVGSDSCSWTRFSILGVIPVARSGGDPDHARSAFGRCVAEAVFWTPAAVLPGPGVSWAHVDANTARVTLARGELSQSVDVKVDVEGRPLSVSFMRWTNANPDNAYRLQPFGGFLTDFREIQGYRVPFRVEAGNMFGTSEYFAFFKAEITGIRFPQAAV